MNVCVGGCTLPEAWLAAMGKMEASLGACDTRYPASISLEILVMGIRYHPHPGPQEGVLVTTDWAS